MGYTQLAKLAGLLFCLSAAASVSAASLEKLINPGPLSEAHAEFEETCDSCHQFFKQGQQTTLCLDCHEDITGDIAKRENFHGKNEIISLGKCNDCHTEHEGRDFDTKGLIPETFDHSLTEFQLAGSHQTAPCTSCHKPEDKFREASSACADCHAEDDVHNNGLGADCGSCHNPEAWSSIDFDHEETSGFALVGAHESQACAACHLDQQYESTPSECVACHKVDDVHKGERGDDCGACHAENDWRKSIFDHAKKTDFELLGAHEELSCRSCHLENMSLEKPPSTCFGCHSADDIHRGQRGTECDSCHSNDTWEIEFDHKKETGFALNGAHASQSCNTCHVNGMEEQLPTDCEGCHSDDDPHEQTLGACDSCHSEEAWLVKIRFDHEFTPFPLVGLHNVATCEQCHDSLRFENVPHECIECHAVDDKHDGNFGTSCSDCHNPGGWELWSFDHDTQTSFALTGAHEDLICSSCHGDTNVMAENTSAECINCHLADDRHEGQFGKACDRCHTTRSFEDDVRFR